MTTNLFEDAQRAAGSKPDKIDWDAGRRAFMRTCGIGVAGSALLAAVGSVNQAEAATTNIDPDILNFALNLEYLEAEFYLIAAFGRRLSDSDATGTGRAGVAVGGRKVVGLSPAIQSYANEIANDEENHVKLIRSALGSQAVARPQIDLVNSFRAAGIAAGLGAFDAFASENNFLLASFIFEDVGVTAYKGAARLITNKDVLETAAGLLAVEAYHAGIIRTVLYSKGLYDQAQKISDLRDGADGPTDLDQGIGTAAVANLTPTDAAGLAFSRSVPQVRAITYLSPTATKGGFYPNGLNGAFGPQAA